MSLNEFTELFNSVGFPVICCVVLFKMNKDQAASYRDMLNEFRMTIEKHSDAIRDLTNEVNKRG